MNRFFVKGVLDDQGLIEDQQDVKHIRKVLRLQLGDRVELCDEDQEYIGPIKEMTEDLVVVGPLEKTHKKRESPLEIHLFQGLPKGEKMEWILQKTTELGVSAVHAVAMDRSIAKLKKTSKLERWEKILYEAAKQSKRIQIPTIDYYDQLQKIDFSSYDEVLIPYEEALAGRLVGPKSKEGGRLAILIGPEGGISPEEIRYLQEEVKGRLVSLGPRILRTETAAIACLAVLQYELGDLKSNDES